MRANLTLVSPIAKYHYTYRETVALLPKEYRILLEKNKAKNEDTAKALFIWTMKYGRHWLDTSTMMVFQFVLWRTYTYYKQAELITRSHFLRGVWDSKNSESNCAPATSSTHTLYKALGVLEEIGFIRQTAIKINGSDAVSLFEIDCKKVLEHSRVREDDVAKLRESRKSKAQVIDFPIEDDSFLHRRRECTSALPPVVHKCTTEGKPKTSKPKEEETKVTSCSVPRNEDSDAIDCKSKVEEVIRRATARTVALREAKVARAARGATISLSDLNATWKQVMVSVYGSCTVAGLTTREYGIFRRMVKGHPPECSWKEFLTWVVNNWQQINKESRELSEYRKKKSGEWALAQEQAIFLFSKAPDLFNMVRCYGRLLKRFSQKTLEGRGPAREDSAEVVELKAKLEAATRQERTNRQLLQKVLSAKATPVAAVRPARRVVVTVDPENDRFFRDADDDQLPEWK